jgi:hypothetical protein
LKAADDDMVTPAQITDAYDGMQTVSPLSGLTGFALHACAIMTRHLDVRQLVAWFLAEAWQLESPKQHVLLHLLAARVSLGITKAVQLCPCSK